MEIKKTENLNVTLSKKANAGIYVQGWGEMVDFDFTDTDDNGVTHNVEVKVPLELARSLAEELTTDLASYDKSQEEKKAEAEAEEAEKIAAEQGVEDLLGDE